MEDFEEEVAGQGGFEDQEGVHAGLLAVVDHKGGVGEEGGGEQRGSIAFRGE